MQTRHQTSELPSDKLKKSKAAHHGEPLRLPQSEKLCEDDAHHSKHEGQLVDEFHLLNVKIFFNPFSRSMSLHLRDPLDVVSDPGFWVPSNCSSPETLALLLSCAQPDKHKIFMQNFFIFLFFVYITN